MSTGTFSFTIQVTDNMGATAIQSLSITINPALTITTTSLSVGYVGAVYSQYLAASDGTPPVTWSLTDGSLPAGLSLDTSTGMITGTPTMSGTSIFTVQLTDHDGTTVTQPLSITINSFFASESPPAGDIGVPYSQTLATSGSTPYNWSLEYGSLPDGLSLDSSGSITGTPTVVGIFTFTTQVTGITTEVLTVNLSIMINPMLVIIKASLPTGKVGVPYIQTLVASGGTTPYAWASEGLLPFGLSLDSTTDVITGTPTTAGTFTFAVQLSDSVGAVVRQVLSITINN